jgi:hypothetical protein
MRKQKPLGILTGTSFSLKKYNRKVNRLVDSFKQTIPLLANGMPDFSAKCAENSPFNPETIKSYRLARGMQKITNLLARFKYECTPSRTS